MAERLIDVWVYNFSESTKMRCSRSKDVILDMIWSAASNEDEIDIFVDSKDYDGLVDRIPEECNDGAIRTDSEVSNVAFNFLLLEEQAVMNKHTEAYYKLVSKYGCEKEMTQEIYER